MHFDQFLQQLKKETFIIDSIEMVQLGEKTKVQLNLAMHLEFHFLSGLTFSSRSDQLGPNRVSSNWFRLHSRK